MTRPLFYPGASVRLSATLEVDGTRTDAASVILRLKDPDETVAESMLTHDGAGEWHADVPVTAGQWWYRWETIAPQSAMEGSFDVAHSHVD